MISDGGAAWWRTVEVLQVDERIAPTGDPARNANDLVDLLLDPTATPAERRHLMPVELPDGTNWAGFFGENAQLGGQGQQGVALDFSRRIETTDWFGVGGDAAGLSLDATIAPPGAALKPSADANRSELADEKVQAAAGGKKREVFAKSSANSADKSKADTGLPLGSSSTQCKLLR
jgi:hypothetical protein